MSFGPPKSRRNIYSQAAARRSNSMPPPCFTTTKMGLGFYSNQKCNQPQQLPRNYPLSITKETGWSMSHPLTPNPNAPQRGGMVLTRPSTSTQALMSSNHHNNNNNSRNSFKPEISNQSLSKSQSQPVNQYTSPSPQPGQTPKPITVCAVGSKMPDGEEGVQYVRMNWEDILGGKEGLAGMRVSMAPPTDPDKNRQVQISFGNQPGGVPEGSIPLKVLSFEPVEGYSSKLTGGSAPTSPRLGPPALESREQLQRPSAPQSYSSQMSIGGGSNNGVMRSQQQQQQSQQQPDVQIPGLGLQPEHMRQIAQAIPGLQPEQMEQIAQSVRAQQMKIIQAQIAQAQGGGQEVQMPQGQPQAIQVKIPHGFGQAAQGSQMQMQPQTPMRPQQYQPSQMPMRALPQHYQQMQMPMRGQPQQYQQMQMSQGQVPPVGMRSQSQQYQVGQVPAGIRSSKYHQLQMSQGSPGMRSQQYRQFRSQAQGRPMSATIQSQRRCGTCGDCPGCDFKQCYDFKLPYRRR